MEKIGVLRKSGVISNIRWLFLVKNYIRSRVIDIRKLEVGGRGLLSCIVLSVGSTYLIIKRMERGY